MFSVMIGIDIIQLALSLSFFKDVVGLAR